MKTYAELEREAYMAGNTELAKLYAELDDVDRAVKAYEDLRNNHE
jgi:hypothetical protein